jgi:hypothetical protein
MDVFPNVEMFTSPLRHNTFQPAQSANGKSTVLTTIFIPNPQILFKEIVHHIAKLQVRNNSVYNLPSVVRNFLSIRSNLFEMED